MQRKSAWRGQRYKGNIYQDEYEVSSTMSGVIWCDIDDPETNLPHATGHPFTEKDVNRQHFSQTGTQRVHTGNSYGQPTFQDREIVTQEMDICGYHWAKQNPFREAPKEIPAEPNEEYLKGYREGIIHGETIS